VKSWSQISLRIGEEKNTKDIDFGCISPPNLYTNNFLSKAKQNYTDNLLKITKKNVTESLVELKHTSLAGNIRNIGYDSLYVYYWTNHQIFIYKDT
jgi:predicted nucleic acid-binding protein